MDVTLLELDSLRKLSDQLVLLIVVTLRLKALDTKEVRH